MRAPVLAVTAHLGGRTRGALGVVLVVALLAACGDTTPDSSSSAFFTIRPVTRQAPPPCVAPALAELRNGEPFACYELGPAAVDASDVKSATVGREPTTQTTDVEFELSPAGVKRWNAMARGVGLGGKAAIVVDDAIASTPRLETTVFPGKGRVTGLDAAAAEQLAKRLNRG